MTSGEAMREARKKAGLTVRELGERSGLHWSMIASLERGVHGPSLTTVEILADALGLSIDEYVGHKVKEAVD